MSTSTSIHGREVREYTQVIELYNMLLLAVRLHKDGEHAYKIYSVISVGMSTSTSTSIYISQRGKWGGRQDLIGALAPKRIPTI